ncbi:HNH endonuclease [Paenisporosarcina macmurdoensis]|uniref:HNH endonuclease n=1 Tax=Paenisporosarcina macmurdoensis TaxID=212659 RepID=A0ABW1L7C7_9BACL
MTEFVLIDDIEDVRRNIIKFNDDLKENKEMRKRFLSHFRQWYYIKELDLFAPSKYIGYKNMNAHKYNNKDGTVADGRKTEATLKTWFVKRDMPELFEELQKRMSEFGRVKANSELHILKDEIEQFEKGIKTIIGKGLAEIPGIRILPMADSDPEFTGQSIQEVQEWFKNELPYKDFNYTKGLNAERGTLVLFQYKAHIVASAILDQKVVFNKRLGGVYRGSYRFIPSSIAVFSPINSLEMKEVWDDFVGFNIVQQNLDIHMYPVFCDLLHGKKLNYVIEETNEESFQDAIERMILRPPIIIKDVPKDPISVPLREKSQRWVRNIDTSKRAVMEANYKCEFNDNHLSFTSNTTGRNYVEAHHLIPMKFQMEFKKSLDVEANIVPLCPLCHKAVHHASLEEKEPIIRALYLARKDRLQNCEIGIDYKDLISYYD